MTSRTFSGKCTGNPRLVPVTEVTAADETARSDAGWDKHNHPKRGTVGKPGAWKVAVPCFHTSTDGPAYAKHMREVHGAKLAPKPGLIGKGFRAPAATAGEKLALGKAVRIRLADGTDVNGQVWSEADPTLLGARRGTAFFAVADGIAYVFEFDTKAPGRPCSGRLVDGARGIGEKVTVTLLRGAVADMTLVDDVPAEPVNVPAPVVPDIVTEAVESGRLTVVHVSDTPAARILGEPVETPAPAPAEHGITAAELEAAGIPGGRVERVAPETVPAPMPKQSYAARKASNRELAAAMRAAGVKVTPDTWHAAKAGAPLETLTGAR